MKDLHIDKIATDILEQRCALLLGPEILITGGQPISESFRQYILDHYGQHVLHVFDRDGVFKFTDDKAKKRVQTAGMKGFNEQIQPDFDILQKLLAIPFHLVLQITPDTLLSDAAHQYSVQHQFKYFCGGGKSIEPVDAPSIVNPLLYNLCGVWDRFDTVLLDYDDIFEFLKSALGDKEKGGLPKNLRSALSECTIFLFLGFQLDKWYTQLLTRWVSDNVKGAERIANAYDFGENGNDIKDFVQYQLEIITVEEEHFELLDELYRHINAEKKLRDLSNPVSPNTLTIRRLVQHGNIEKALEVYLQLSDSINCRNDATMLSGDYQDLKKKRDQYDLTDEKFWEASQRIKFRLLSQIEPYVYTL